MLLSIWELWEKTIAAAASHVDSVVGCRFSGCGGCVGCDGRKKFISCSCTIVGAFRYEWYVALAASLLCFFFFFVCRFFCLALSDVVVKVKH